MMYECAILLCLPLSQFCRWCLALLLTDRSFRLCTRADDTAGLLWADESAEPAGEVLDSGLGGDVESDSESELESFLGQRMGTGVEISSMRLSL